MSDNYAIRRYHRQTVTVIGTSRKKKYLKIFFVLLLAGVIGAAYLVYSSGILADENPRIPQHMITRINLERQANNLAPVQMDDHLANLALAKSQEVKISSLTYSTAPDATAGDNANVFVIPKIFWALSGYDEQLQMFDALENNDNSFHTNVLNGNYRNVGIGVTSDGYNYYIAMKWQ
jgi:uncharacterized protein YkwD